MNKTNWLTIIGVASAIMMAIKPVLDGSGYHFNTKTIVELAAAALMAVAGYFAKGTDSE